MNCPLCTKNTKLYFSKYHRDFFRCSACSLIFMNPQPSDDEIKKIYQQDYYQPWGLEDDVSLTAEMKIKNFHERLNAIECYASKGKILDIGCATGFFMQAAEARGWDVYGVEISSYSSEIAQNKFGIDRVYNTTLDKAGLEDEIFDTLFLSDLLEHVPDLSTFMQDASRILKKNGIIAIVTPNTEALSARILKKHWPHVKEEHLFYFSPRSIQTLLEKFGFEIHKISSSPKLLSINYFTRQIASYHFPILSSVAKWLTKKMPSGIGKKIITIPAGEMLVIAEKK